MADNIVNFLYFVRSILYEYQTNIIFLSVSGTQYAPGVAYILQERGKHGEENIIPLRSEI